MRDPRAQGLQIFHLLVPSPARASIPASLPCISLCVLMCTQVVAHMTSPASIVWEHTVQHICSFSLNAIRSPMQKDPLLL